MASSRPVDSTSSNTSHGRAPRKDRIPGEFFIPNSPMGIFHIIYNIYTYTFIHIYICIIYVYYIHIFKQAYHQPFSLQSRGSIPCLRTCRTRQWHASDTWTMTYDQVIGNAPVPLDIYIYDYICIDGWPITVVIPSYSHSSHWNWG